MSLVAHHGEGAGNVQQCQGGAEVPEAENMREDGREVEGDEDGAAWQQ